MGIARCGSQLFLMESTVRPFSGSILQLGRQDIYFDYPTYRAHAEQLGVRLTPLDVVTKRKNPYFPELDSIDDTAFFKSLGFDTVHSIDSSDFENATHVHDLNYPVPADLHNRYDVIFNGGTLEHIFHTPNVLANMHAMLKVGGKLIHYAPAFNFVDHGFYNFSPCLFLDYYEANHYRFCTTYLVCHSAPINPFIDPLIIKYAPGDLDQYSLGGLNKDVLVGREMMQTFLTVEKVPESTCTEIPQQGFYRKVWAQAK